MTMPVSWGGVPGRRSRLVVGGIVAAVVMLALLGVGIATMTGALSSAPDRRDPADVAKAFIERYAVHDPGACELVTVSLRKRFTRDGRCVGDAHGTTPRIDVLNARTCGDRSMFEAGVTPSGEIGEGYVSVGLEQVGEEWAVHSVLPLDDRNLIRPTTCRPANKEYVG
ncbi:MAG: hypothetical protein ACRDRU_22780 [Pseudonocardiaceae bacterium]